MIIDARRACHWTLLRLAGRVPDGLLTESRRLLARGRYVEMARIVALAVAGRGIALHEDDLRCVSEILGDAGQSAVALGAPGYGDPMPRHTFFAGGPRPAARTDGVDGTAVLAALAEPAAHGLWRAWRVPDGGHCRHATPVFVVEVDANADAAGVAERFQDRLIAAGETCPQVEVYEAGDWLPAYQRAARAEGDLLWSRTPDPGVRIASVIDGFVGVGPAGWEDAELVEDDDERDRILAYLDAGSPVLLTIALLNDVIDPDRGRVVPMNFRTDGTWIWNDISAYYLRVYGFRPDPALVAHIGANGHTMPEVDGVAEFRAVSLLYRSPEEGEEGEDATAACRWR